MNYIKNKLTQEKWGIDFVCSKFYENEILKDEYVFIEETEFFSDINLSKGFCILSLDTPYYTRKMEEEGIYEDFVDYIDTKLEYERQQRKLEEQRQLAFEQRENQEQSYEDWLSEQAEVIPLIEPQPSQTLLDFKEKYLG